jgi:hypothetical protein
MLFRSRFVFVIDRNIAGSVDLILAIHYKPSTAASKLSLYLARMKVTLAFSIKNFDYTISKSEPNSFVNYVDNSNALFTETRDSSNLCVLI